MSGTPPRPARLHHRCFSKSVPLRLLALLLIPVTMLAPADTGAVRSHAVILPGQEHNLIKTSWPGIACWFWTAREFEPEGYKQFIDLHAAHTRVQLVTTSIRHPVEVTDPAVHRQLKAAAEYADSKGLRLALDLDARLAREAFQKLHPREMQELLRPREYPMSGAGNLEVTIEAPDFGDHYTYRAPSYYCVSSRFLRAYSYTSSADGIDPDSIEEISGRCLIIEESPHKVRLMIPQHEQDAGRKLGVLAAFALLTPDIFAPNLLSFEDGILRQYADLPLAGVCKDEWGFPGRFVSHAEDFWYSDAMARRFAEKHGGHELLAELFHMWQPQAGRDAQRLQAINRYMQLCWQRNVEIETHFYRSVKEVFGEQAYVGTHPTWFPIPRAEEVYKNGLHWWQAPRDLAQTDESTPFAVRTALTKKWHSPLWYNMYYANNIADYEEDVWRHLLGGGRMNLHPLFPAPDRSLNTLLLNSRIFEVEMRVRLLNYISTAPVDCPVLVVFGHPSAMNWAHEGFGDTGLGVTDALWEQGIYADLAPSTELGGALRVAESGRIAYGPQEYAAAVIYHPQFEPESTAAFFQQAAAAEQTSLFRVGDWTRDFEGRPFEGNAALPASMRPGDAATIVREILAHVKEQGIAAQTPATARTATALPASMMPQPRGHCRLLDGTHIYASGEHDVLGDPLQKTLQVSGQTVHFDAIGLAAFRLDQHGALEALAAGGLASFAAGAFSVTLDERADIALWKDADRQWHGVLHGNDPVPAALLQITGNWTRVSLPEPVEAQQ